MNNNMRPFDIFNWFDKIKDLNTYTSDEKLKLYRLYYEGNKHHLVQFYKTAALARNNPNRIPEFYEQAPVGYHVDRGGRFERNTFTIYHRNLAKNVATAMSNLLMGKTPNINISTGNKKKDLQFNRMFEKIRDVNDFDTLLQKALEYKSFSGGVAIKIVLDSDFSEYPILERPYALDEIIVNRKYGKIVSIVFLDTYKKDDIEYTLYSEYGKGYIKYKLAKDKIDHNGKTVREEVPLSTLEETKSLMNINIFDANNKPYDQILAFYMENPSGESDLKDILDDMQLYDEIYSNLGNFIRKNRVRVPKRESDLVLGEDGGSILPGAYDTDYDIIYDGDRPQADRNPIPMPAMVDMNTQISGYVRAFEEVQKNIARAVGLSVKAIDGDDRSGANTSENALLIRENQDIKTRDRLSVGFTKSLQYLTKLLMSLSEFKVNGDVVFLANNTSEWNVSVELYDPTAPDFSDIVKETIVLKNAGLIDDIEALRRVWVDTEKKTEEEVLAMFNALNGNVDEEEQDESEDKSQGE